MRPATPAGAGSEIGAHEILLRLQRRQRLLELREVLFHERRDRLGRLRALLDQRVGEQFAHRRMLGNRLVHQRLRERGLVALVVPVPPVADQVDQEVAPEARAIFPGKPRGFEAGGRVVGVDVDDRNLEAAGEAARVAGAVRLAGSGRETDLVVGDDVDRAVGVVAGEPREVQRLCDDALAWKCRVAVDQDRQRAGAFESRAAGLAGHRAGGARHADHDRIHRFEMARVRRDRDVHLSAWRGRAGTGVILDVAHPAQIEAQRLRRDRILELGEDLRVGLLENVREDVEPAAMRHADHGLARAAVGGAADDLVQDRHEHVEPFDGESCLAGEGAMQEALEDFDLRDAIEQRRGAGRVHRRQEPARLRRMTQPFPFFGHEDLRVIEACRRAVDTPQLLDGVVGVGRRLPQPDRPPAMPAAASGRRP